MSPRCAIVAWCDGQIHALTAHYIAATAAGAVLSGAFMWHSREWITCIPLVGEFQHTVFVILLAHFVHLCLLSDFSYYYISQVLVNGDTSLSFIPVEI